MSASLIALLFFLAFVMGITTLLLAAQQIAAARKRRQQGTNRPIVLRRVTRPDRTRKGIITGRFDRWFVTLLRESGALWDPMAATLLSIFLGVLCGALCYLWQEDTVIAVFGVAIGMILPLPYLLWKQRKRIRKLQEQLPGSLEMLSRSVLAGQSLDQAIKLVGGQSPEPLAREFRWCAKQLEMGLSMASVMRLLVERIQLQDIRIFTTTLTVHRQTGGNVAKVLSRLANVVRNRLSYRRQLRVATAAGRTSAVLVGIIGPVIFLFFLMFRTEYLDAMLHQPLGQTLLFTAAMLELIGLVWTWRLLKPAY